MFFSCWSCSWKRVSVICRRHGFETDALLKGGVLLKVVLNWCKSRWYVPSGPQLGSVSNHFTGPVTTDDAVRELFLPETRTHFPFSSYKHNEVYLCSDRASNNNTLMIHACLEPDRPVFYWGGRRNDFGRNSINTLGVIKRNKYSAFWTS